MSTVAGLPYAEVEFTKEGSVFDAAEVAALSAMIRDASVTDLLVISHGWNNDMADARTLYQKFLACVRAVLDAKAVQNLGARTLGVFAVLWPSKKFADDELIPSGAAAAGSAVSMGFVQDQFGRFDAALASPDKAATLQHARALIPALQNSPKAQEEFANAIRSVLSDSSKSPDDASSDFFAANGRDLMDRLSKPTMLAPAPAATGGAASISTGPGGGAASIGQTFSGVLAAASNLLNYSTYYLMKDRAGVVGRTGVDDVIAGLKTSAPAIRLHLIGHSFGGRLVTCAADGAGRPAPVVVDTMTLLQAAFSHNGFASKYDGANDGAFRSVLVQHKVKGPILVTHSNKDRAVGIAYPLASRIAGQAAAALGDENDKYGGIGRNGAQHTPERVVGTLLAVGQPYTFDAGKIYNLNSDLIINEHSDICHNEVAYALLTAVATS
jgi:hypothetical protein